jgi:hypothetical protein
MVNPSISSYVGSMRNSFKLVFLLSTFSSVTVAQEGVTVPLWLKNKIDIYQKSHPNISAQLTKYNGKIAYYVPPRCCDIPSELYDEGGNLICYPDGGFAGGDGKCPSFRLERNGKPNISKD